MVVLGYALAVVVGVLLGCLGGGGAILTVPILVYVFGEGTRQAVPTSLFVVGLTSLVGAIRHRYHGQVRFDAVLTFGPMAILGSLLGTQAGIRVSERLQLTVFAMVMLLAAGSMLRRGAVPASTAAPPRRSVRMLAPLGAGVGFLTGFVGVGGGFLYVPALALLAGLEMKTAVGTSLALIAMSSAAGLVGYLGHVALNWPLVAGFSGLAFVGVALGTALVPRLSQQLLRRTFAIFLLLMGAFVLLRGEG